MISEPVVVQESAREWDTWPDEDVTEKGLVYWKTLLSADITHSEALTMGIAKIPPGEALHEHRHLPGRDLPHSPRTRRGPDRWQTAARHSGFCGLHTGQRPALLREHGSDGSTVRLRLSCELVRGDRTHLRGVSLDCCLGEQLGRYSKSYFAA